MHKSSTSNFALWYEYICVRASVLVLCLRCPRPRNVTRSIADCVKYFWIAIFNFCIGYRKAIFSNTKGGCVFASQILLLVVLLFRGIFRRISSTRSVMFSDPFLCSNKNPILCIEKHVGFTKINGKRKTYGQRTVRIAAFSTFLLIVILDKN